MEHLLLFFSRAMSNSVTITAEKEKKNEATINCMAYTTYICVYMYVGT